MNNASTNAVTSSHSSSSSKEEATQKWELNVAVDIILLTVPVALAILTIVVNTLLIVVVRKTPSLQTLSNMFITSLAVDDLLVGVVLLADCIFAMSVVKSHNRLVARRLCVLLVSFSMGSNLLSIVHLTVISIDRCLCIKVPLFYARHVNDKVALVVIVVIWVLGAGYVAVPHVYHADLDGDLVICHVTNVVSKEYVLFLNGGVYLASLLISILMYTIIVHAAAVHRKQIEKLSRRTALGRIESTTDGDAARSSRPKEAKSHASSLHVATDNLSHRQTEESADGLKPMRHADVYRHKPYPHCHTRDFDTYWRNIQFFITVVGVYVVLITPFFVITCLDYFVEVNLLLYDVFSFVALLNSAANFFIFYFINAGFRKGLHKTIRWRRTTFRL